MLPIFNSQTRLSSKGVKVGLHIKANVLYNKYKLHLALDPWDDQHVLKNSHVSVVLLYHCLSRKYLKKVSDKQIMAMLWDIA